MKTVVMLLGPSSAGKSTTCDALQNGYGYRVCSIDDECEKASKERLNFVEDTLKSEGVFEKLAPFMSREEVLNLSLNGILHIKNRKGNPFDHRFKNPNYPLLEVKLIKAGFDQQDREMLTPLLRSVGDIYDKWKYPNLEDRLLKNAFDLLTSADESVVIDMVPLGTPEETTKLVEDFHEKTQEYKQQHGEDSIQTFVVLAYCPPMKLSDRLYQRNVNAERDNQPGNKRDWRLGISHLGILYGKKDSYPETPSSLDTLSHAELMKVSYMHNEKKPVGLSDANPYVLSNIQLLKNAAKAAIDANRFAKMYGITGDSDKVSLSVSPSLKHDAIIDTSVGSPDELAKKVVAVTEPEKTKNTIRNK